MGIKTNGMFSFPFLSTFGQRGSLDCACLEQLCMHNYYSDIKRFADCGFYNVTNVRNHKKNRDGEARRRGGKNTRLSERESQRET